MAGEGILSLPVLSFARSIRPIPFSGADLFPWLAPIALAIRRRGGDVFFFPDRPHLTAISRLGRGGRSRPGIHGFGKMSRPLPVFSFARSIRPIPLAGADLFPWLAPIALAIRRRGGDVFFFPDRPHLTACSRSGRGGCPMPGVQGFGKMSRPVSSQEGTNFGGGDRAVLSRLESRKSQRADGGSDQFEDEIIERLEEAADLPVSSLCQGDPIPCVAVGRAFEEEFQGRDRTSIEPDPSRGDTFGVVRGHPSLDLHKVGAGDGIAWMKDALRQVSIVRKEERPFGLEVEPANVKQGVNRREKLAKRRPSFGVVQGGDHSPRFIEKEKKGLRFPRKRFSFDQDAVRVGVDAGSWLCDDGSID